MKWVLAVEILAVLGAMVVAGRTRTRIWIAGVVAGFALGQPFKELAADHAVSAALTVPLSVVGAGAIALLWRAALRSRRS